MSAQLSLSPPPPAPRELDVPTPAIIELRGVSKDYDSGAGTVHALRNLDLTIARGEFVAVVGASGSGKSTLMNILGCLDRPTRGTYRIAGFEVTAPAVAVLAPRFFANLLARKGARTNDERAIVRNRLIGFIFQGFNLLPRTTALENCELPLQYRGVGRAERRARAIRALEAVQLVDRMHHTPNQLSGGQQQRVAIARALVTEPPLLLADEPTGNLDTRTSLEVLALLQKLNREMQITIVLVTHEHDIAACASRVITFKDGRMVSDIVQERPLDAAAELLALPPEESYEAEAAGDEAGDPALAQRRRLGGPLKLSIFFVMAGAAILGLAIGFAYDALILAERVVWIPVVFSLVLEAWAGARYGRRTLGRSLTSDQRVRLALGYTTAISVVVAPILAFRMDTIAPALADRLEELSSGGIAIAMVATLVVLGALSLLRYLLLSLFLASALMLLILNAILLALSAIVRNKTRAALTVLGILIGVAAVVTVTALAGGASEKVGSEIDSFAANALFINPQATQQSGVRGKSTGRLTEADARAIAREAVSVAAVAPWLSTTGQVIYGDRNVATMLVGTTSTYFPIRKYKVARGEQWTEADETIKTKVCVIGATVAEKLFGTEDPIGHVIRIARSPYRIVGVLEARGTSPFGDDQDDRLLMPIGSFRARVMHTSPGRADMLIASSTNENTTLRAQRQITQILRQRHRIAEGREADFTVNTQMEFRQAQQAISEVLSALLLAVAGVSLLVGGIGVMNIMLVSVAERTREIGIRMSIGAREKDILIQFLIEAVVLSIVGGLLGIAVGVSGTLGLGYVLGWSVAPTATSIAIAVGTSAAIGIVFGFFPARRAARLDPIEALRTE